MSRFKHLHLLDRELEATIAIRSSQTPPTVVLRWLTQPFQGVHGCWAVPSGVEGSQILCDQSCRGELLLLCSCPFVICSLAGIHYLSRPSCLLCVLQNQTFALTGSSVWLAYIVEAFDCWNPGENWMHCLDWRCILEALDSTELLRVESVAKMSTFIGLLFRLHHHHWIELWLILFHLVLSSVLCLVRPYWIFLHVGRCRSGNKVFLCKVLAGVVLSVCPLTILLHDVMGLWEPCLQKVRGTTDMMGMTTPSPLSGQGKPIYLKWKVHRAWPGLGSSLRPRNSTPGIYFYWLYTDISALFLTWKMFETS